MEKDYLLISGIQHFSFCRRQWALIHIENQWKENQLTAEGKVLHERMHDIHIITKRKDVITLRGIPVRSEELMIVGECDAVELIPDENGFELKGRTGKWHIHPVEYKRGKTKSDDCDRLQLAAECMCLEEMLSCHVLKGSLYYGEARHREDVDINTELRTKLCNMIKEMHGYYDRGYTPRAKPAKACKNCSLSDICLPELTKKQNVHDYIKRHVQEGNN